MIALGFVKARRPSGPPKHDQQGRDSRSSSGVPKRPYPLALHPPNGKSWLDELVSTLFVSVRREHTSSVRVRSAKIHQTRKSITHIEDSKVVDRDHSAFQTFCDLETLALTIHSMLAE